MMLIRDALAQFAKPLLLMRSGCGRITHMSLVTGTLLGPYQILAPLGAGGMGEVYKAHDTRLNRFVAIKILPLERVTHEGRRQRFIQEAQAASALNHPNIITIYDISVDNGREYIVMEYVP